MAEGGHESSKQQDSPKVVAVVGKRRAGKTTLINKLFHQDDIVVLWTTKIERKSNETLTAIDVPGPDLADIAAWKKTLRDLWRYSGKVDLFLLCIPAGPNNAFDEGTSEVMKSLQEEFGKDVWKHCIVVFTYSNVSLTANAGAANAERNYTAYLQTFTDKFREELRKIGVKETVKTIFQYKYGPERNKDTIITTPAGQKDKDPVIPGSEEESWIDDILNLISTKCDLLSKFNLKKYRLQQNSTKGGIVGALSGAFGGGLAGVGVGVLVGAAGGPIGMGIGALIGGGVGVVGGGSLGGGTGAVVPYARDLMEESKEKKKEKERQENQK